MWGFDFFNNHKTKRGELSVFTPFFIFLLMGTVRENLRLCMVN